MIIPIRCTSCGKPLGHLWEEFVEETNKGTEKKKILDSFGLDRYCCRAILMGHVELIDLAAEFKKHDRYNITSNSFYF